MAVEFKDLKTIKGRVAFLINQNPDLAFDTDRLILTYLYREIGSDVVNDMSGYDLFLRLVSTYEPLTKIDSISRAKRKVIERMKKQGLFNEKSEPIKKTLFKIRNFD